MRYGKAIGTKTGLAVEVRRGETGIPGTGSKGASTRLRAENAERPAPHTKGCLSQGETCEIALANTREAIQLRLEVAEEDARREPASELGTLAEVTV